METELPPVGKKTRPTENPYRIYRSADGTWEWRVLKAYKSDENAPYARWFLATKSPFTYGSFELGDGYIADVKANGILVLISS